MHQEANVLPPLFPPDGDQQETAKPDPEEWLALRARGRAARALEALLLRHAMLPTVLPWM